MFLVALAIIVLLKSFFGVSLVVLGPFALSYIMYATYSNPQQDVITRFVADYVEVPQNLLFRAVVFFVIGVIGILLYLLKDNLLWLSRDL